LVSAGDIQSEHAQEWVDNLVERSRKSSEHVLELVRREVAAQLKKIDTGSLEHIANQVSELLKRSADAGRSATKDATKQATKTAKDTAKAGRAAAEKVIPGVAKKKKAPAKKVAAAKKAPAKKAAAVKKAAKKAPAKKATAAKKAVKRASS
jgi:polyhydroxyalkanoate synthesis regulator phasin